LNSSVYFARFALSISSPSLIFSYGIRSAGARSLRDRYHVRSGTTATIRFAFAEARLSPANPVRARSIMTSTGEVLKAFIMFRRVTLAQNCVVNGRNQLND
jgi:hypothetical protein